MGKLTLYGMIISPPVRAVLLTLKALDLPYEYVEVNLFGGEQHSEEFLAKNPQHTVPVLDDGGNFIGDSHAIITYLVSKYGKDDSLYPRDCLQRARVDERLYYESCRIYNSLWFISSLVFLKNDTFVPKHKVDAIVEVYGMLEMFLKNSIYMAGDALTLADFSVVSTVTSLPAILDIDAEKYPKLCAWIKRLEHLPYYEEANGIGARAYVDLLKSKKLRFEQ